GHRLLAGHGRSGPAAERDPFPIPGGCAAHDGGPRPVAATRFGHVRLARRGGLKAPCTRCSPLPPRSKELMARILAVDDSPSMRQMVSIALTGAGYEVEQACDGVEALEIAQKSRFDLVITDVNMPNMDGITLVRELRGKANYKFVPLLVL